MSLATFVPHRGLETAIAMARRLQEECNAQIQDVEAIGNETVIRLTIPTAAFGRLDRRRTDLWSSFVRENVETRRALAALTRERIDERRVWLEGSRSMASATRGSLVSLRLDVGSGAPTEP